MIRAELIAKASETREINNIQEDNETVAFLPYYCSWYQFMFPRPKYIKDDDEVVPSQK